MPETLTLLMDWYQRGGVMMAPIALCSVLTLAVTLERCWELRHARQFPAREIERLRARADARPAGADGAGALAEAAGAPGMEGHPVGRILARGLAVAPLTPGRFREAAQDQARRENHHLERGLVVLEVVVGVAPLLGLLGTALGMIEVFANLSATGAARTEALSGGISQALLTTVAGLSVGIPALIAHNLFARRVESLGLVIEEEVVYFFHRLFPEADL